MATRARAAATVSNGALASALLTVLAVGAVFAVNEYTGHLVSETRATASPDRLRTLAHGTWTRWDTRVQVALARNESLVHELSHGPERVRSTLVQNPRTPFDVLVEMSATTWLAAATLANADTTDVPPDVLRKIATGPFKLSLARDLVDNPRTPPELADALRRQIRLRQER